MHKVPMTYKTVEVNSPELKNTNFGESYIAGLFLVLILLIVVCLAIEV